MNKIKSFFFGVVLYPYAVVIYGIIVGAFGIFNNEKFAGGTVPVYFYGMWSIYVGLIIWLVAFAYLFYCVWKSGRRAGE